MKKFVLALALVSIAAGSALAVTELSTPGTPGGPVIPPNREVCWSQPMNDAMTAVSSEYISASGLESRVANDFSFTADRAIGHATWWGQYYNYSSNMPDAATFNLFWYDDPNFNCVPTELYCTYVVPNNAGETLVVPPDRFVYNVDLNLPDCCYLADLLYWFVAQCGDHRSLPGAGQWGRKGADGIMLCESVIWSPYFGINVWTPLSALGISNYDASQEFNCVDCGISPTEETTWGAIKTLYR
jgi:hypothetical protein